MGSGRGGVALIAILAGVAYTAISLHRYSIFMVGEDLALFGQALRGYGEGGPPLSSIKHPDGFNLLGDHFTAIIACLGPFYRLWPDIRLLLVAQSVLFAVAVLVVGLFAWRRLGTAWATVLSVGLACSWGIVHAILFDFHEIAFAVPLLAIGLVCVAEERWAGLVISTVLLWLTKEDCTFLTAGIGLLLIARRRVWPGLALGAASVAVFLLLTRAVIPALSFTGRYTYFDVVDAKPMWQNVADHLTGDQFWVFLVVLLLTAGLGAYSPYLLVLLPVMASRLVSADHLVSASQEYFRLQHHYNATIMVICFMAIIDSLWRWFKATDTGRRTLDQCLVAAVQSVLLAAGLVYGVTLVAQLGDLGRSYETCDHCQEKATAVALIPAGARVAADSYTIPQLVDKASPVLTDPDWLDQPEPVFDVEWIITDTGSIAYDNWTNQWQTHLASQLPQWGYRLVWSGNSASVWTNTG